MSLNPNNPNQHSLFQKVQKGNSTEVEVSSGVQPESISSISNLEQYSSEDVQVLTFSSKRSLRLSLGARTPFLSKISTQS